ncbi:MAG: hypothetical protein WC119_00835 [Synergistaceae bacterium]
MIDGYVTPPKLVEEVLNEKKVPYQDMSQMAKACLDSNWKQVEVWDTDAQKWEQNRICPRHWNLDAYRVPGFH